MAEEKKHPLVHPVILSGGSGTRLWPKSRALYPKQFHCLTSDITLLQEALFRVNDPTLYAPPLIVCNEEHRFIVAEQAAQINVKLQNIVLEPEGRNTAPAVAVASILVSKLEANGLVLVLASDHHIGDTQAFTNAVRLAIPAALNGYICTFGVKPSSPETGFGYIKRTSEEVSPGCFKIDQFKEKPNLATAQEYVADGRYDWNAGIFLFDANKMLAELNTHEPSIGPACEAAIKEGEIDAWSCTKLNKEAFSKAKATSVDYAVMEKTAFAAVIPMDASWTDVGSWPSVFQTCVSKSTNSDENKGLNIFTQGHVSHIDTRNCFLSTDGPLLAAIGLDNLCVIATDDAVLVLPMDRAQDVGPLTKRLNLNPDTKHITLKHLSAFTPWGACKELSKGDKFKVLQLTIKPGCSTPLLETTFHCRTIVVEGTANVTFGDQLCVLTANQSHHVNAGTKHCVHNPGTGPLVVIEVQSSSGGSGHDRPESPCSSLNAHPSSQQSATSGVCAYKAALLLVVAAASIFFARKR